MPFLFRILTYLEDGQLLSLYNDAQRHLGRGPEHVLRKPWPRRDRAEAEVAKIRQKLEDMYGFAELELLDEGRRVQWLTERPRPSDSKSSAEKRGPRESTTTLDLDEQLTVLCRVNPKRLGTRAWSTFQVYLTLPDPATGEDFVREMEEEGYSRRLALSTLHWDIKKGFVRLGEPEVARATEEELMAVLQIVPAADAESTLPETVSEISE